jgi:hypothetical protein
VGINQLKKIGEGIWNKMDTFGGLRILELNPIKGQIPRTFSSERVWET